MPADDAPTLHEALAAAGYRAEPGALLFSARRIVRVTDGVCVGELKAYQSWAWLAAGCPLDERGRVVIESGG